MYILQLKTAEEKITDADSDEIDSIVIDIINSLKNILPEESVVTGEDLSIRIESTMSIEDIKKEMKPVFQYHFNDIRYVTLTNANN
jgi:SpoVK/Ycf46/Vps4 family AAA+-type ATPase